MIVTVVLLTGIVIAQTQPSQPPSATITNDAKTRFRQIHKIGGEPCAKDATLCIGSAPSITVLADSAQLRRWHKLAIANKLEKSQVAKAIRFNGDNALMTAGEEVELAGKIIKLLKKSWGVPIVRIGIATEATGLVVKMFSSSGKEVDALTSRSVPITSK